MSNCDKSKDNECIICGQKIDSNDVTCPRCAWYAFMILLNYDELNKALSEDRLHISTEKLLYGPYSELERN